MVKDEELVRTARIIIEVVAGLDPGVDPDPQFSKQWVITSEEWYKLDDNKKAELLAEFNGKALGYANYLMFQVNQLNWVRTDWIYL